MKFSDFLSAREAAAYLGISVPTLYNWTRNGYVNVKRHPINNYRLYHKKDLDNMLESLRASMDDGDHL